MKLDPEIQAMLDERERTMSDFTDDHRPMRLYGVYLRSLEMPPEKLASQLMHACLDSFLAAEATDPTIRDRFRGTGHGTKAVMYAKNLNILLRGYREAKKLGLPCALVIDRGHVLLPHFTGKPIITGLGIGPVYVDEAKEVTKLFSMTRLDLNLSKHC